MKTVIVFQIMFFTVIGFAASQDGCDDCGGELRYSRDAAMLERAGYSPDAYSIVLSWEERTRDGTNRYVNGMRIRPRTGGEPFDLYIGDDFRVLTDAELRAMGVPQKNWTVQAVTTKTEPAYGNLRSFQSAPRARVTNPTPTGSVELPDLDWSQVLREDEEARKQNKPRRIGVFQDIVPSIEVRGGIPSDGVWEKTDTGTVWTISVIAPGAKGQRVHFDALDLPEDAYVIVFNARDPEEAYGPYTSKDVGDSEGLWVSSCFSEEVGVQCVVPNGVSFEDVHLVIDKIVHIYAGFEDLYWGKAAGSCNLDVTCYSDWQNEAKGVAGMGTIGQTGMLWCTGALISDLDPSTQKPFFLTANHCVSNSSQANSLEVYWFYQTSVCNASPPSPSSVPRTTGGADYLAGVSHYSGNDFTLLKLRNNPPSGVVFLGWTSAAPQTGQNIVPIHHPDGDFKRISFGYIYALDANFIETRYNQGTTEPGSSGCPLFNANSKLIIGQLYGGDASCSNPNGWDKYGRFDKTYPVIASILSGDDDIVPPIDDTIVCGSLESWDTLRGTRNRATILAGRSSADMAFLLVALGGVLFYGRKRSPRSLM